MYAQTQLRPGQSGLESQQPHTSSGRVGDGEELRVCVWVWGGAETLKVTSTRPVSDSEQREK